MRGFVHTIIHKSIIRNRKFSIFHLESTKNDYIVYRIFYKYLQEYKLTMSRKFFCEVDAKVHFLPELAVHFLEILSENFHESFSTLNSIKRILFVCFFIAKIQYLLQP